MTRLECKETFIKDSESRLVIGIWPDWNVKLLDLGSWCLANPIGIWPDWNVKINLAKNPRAVTKLEYDQIGM